MLERVSETVMNGLSRGGTIVVQAQGELYVAIGQDCGCFREPKIGYGGHGYGVIIFVRVVVVGGTVRIGLIRIGYLCKVSEVVGSQGWTSG